MSAPTKGKKATWSGVYVSDRPRDLLGLTLALEADFDAFIGFTGRDQAGTVKQKNVLYYNSASAPTLEDYGVLPIGTIVIAPLLTAPKIFIKKLSSTVAAVTDWFGITAVVES
jgi:hypothetical protein